MSGWDDGIFGNLPTRYQQPAAPGAQLPVLTDDGSAAWPQDQAAPPASQGLDSGYWWPKIIQGLWNTARSGATLPGDVATGKTTMADPLTQARVGDMSQVATFGPGILGATAPEGALTAGAIRRLPSSNSLVLPDAPSAEQLARFGRVENVPLSQLRATQNTMGGASPGDLIPGYGDLPVAALRRDGEYLVFDGHHRAIAAINGGADSMPMHVIDAKDYAPQFAGRPPAPDTISTDDLLRQLTEPLPGATLNTRSNRRP